MQSGQSWKSYTNMSLWSKLLLFDLGNYSSQLSNPGFWPWPCTHPSINLGLLDHTLPKVQRCPGVVKIWSRGAQETQKLDPLQKWDNWLLEYYKLKPNSPYPCDWLDTLTKWFSRDRWDRLTNGRHSLLKKKETKSSILFQLGKIWSKLLRNTNR